ncbi:MAG: hypothetical protein WCC52_02935 [Nitrosotalea sp.]
MTQAKLIYMSHIAYPSDLNQKELGDIKQAINDLTNMIKGKQMRLEAILSQIIERDMITQASYYKIMNLLIEFGKKKGWTEQANYYHDG